MVDFERKLRVDYLLERFPHLSTSPTHRRPDGREYQTVRFDPRTLAVLDEHFGIGTQRQGLGPAVLVCRICGPLDLAQCDGAKHASYYDRFPNGPGLEDNLDALDRGLRQRGPTDG